MELGNFLCFWGGGGNFLLLSFIKAYSLQEIALIRAAASPTLRRYSQNATGVSYVVKECFSPRR